MGRCQRAVLLLAPMLLTLQRARTHARNLYVGTYIGRYIYARQAQLRLLRDSVMHPVAAAAAAGHAA